MYPQLDSDRKQWHELLTQVQQRAEAHLAQLDRLPVSRVTAATEAVSLPEQGGGARVALDEFFRMHANKLVASPGPRYWGFVTGGATPAAVAGDWLSAVFDQNTQSVTGPGDQSALVEVETIELLLELLGLPHAFRGGFVTGATMANFTGLAVGRQWAAARNGHDAARNGVPGDIVVLSATPHSSAVKCLSMLGIGSASLVPVATISGDREAMDPADLERLLQEHTGRGVIVISSAGTVNSVDFDDFAAIEALRARYPFYWHIDAAFGAFAALSDAHRHLLQGWDGADSIAIDCHKWLNVPYDSAFYLVRRDHMKLQLQTFQNSNAPYLGDPEEQFTYLNFGPENSRRFRALPVWLSLQAYGREGFRQLVGDSIAHAALFARRIQEAGYDVIAPLHLNVVCFTPKNGDRTTIDAIIRFLAPRGKVFVTPSVFRGKPCLRAAFVNWMTSAADVDIAITEFAEAISAVCGTQSQQA